MTTQPEGTNRRFVLAAHPAGRPKPDHFKLERAPRPSVAEGEFLVRTRFVSVDPMTRILIDARPLNGAAPPLPIGTVIPGAAVGEIVESRHPEFPVGMLVEGRFGWQEFALSRGVGVRPVASGAPPEAALGVLGLPGFSAYVGLHLAGPIEPGQTLVVSGAAGAVGSAVGPLARARGARLIGVASGDHKRRYLLDLGYDVVIDRTSETWSESIAAALPNGANIYFDNVGGPLFGEILRLMAPRGRIVICGLMAQYNGSEDPSASSIGLSEVLTAIMARSLTVQAFSNTHYENLRAPFIEEVGAMVRSGAMPAVSHVEDGFESIPGAFIGLFDGGVAGKVVVRV